MRWIAYLLLLFVGGGFANADSPMTSRRVALVIANWEYQVGGIFGRIPGPPRDAPIVSAALVKAGFGDIIYAPNVDRERFHKLLREFEEKADGADVALIYFAGHGLSGSGDNWLAPVDLTVENGSELSDHAVSQIELLNALRGANMRVLILDACRDSPFADLSRKPGLAAFEATNTLVLYSAGSGRAAADGNSFASSFAARVQQPGMPLQMLPNFVREDVVLATENDQRPYASTDTVTKPFYLIPGDARCAPFDERWIERLKASAEIEVLRQFIDASPPSCASRKEAEVRIASLAKREVIPMPVNAKQFRDCSYCPWMINVPGGTFDMGSGDEDPHPWSAETPPRKGVEVAPFAAGLFEVTFDEWDACVAEGGCGHYMADDAGWGRGSRPVVSVSWNDAQSYVSWLSKMTGKTYRLLSEAEWEYAARGDPNHSRPRTIFWWGATVNRQYANFGADICCKGATKAPDLWVNTAPVGRFPPNPFGLYDMIGNAWEWVEDCEHSTYHGAPHDGSVWAGACDSERRELRGGSYYDYPGYLRTANRYPDATFVRSDNYGFRIARDM